MTEEEANIQSKAPIDDNSLEEDEKLQQLAMNLENVMPIRSLPKQEYLQATVIPILLEGMSWIIKERPDDPVESLAMFLIKNNPNTPEFHQSIDISECE
ncbi:hypothetical protein M9Y10_001596 [Tritrichomonas musculus]|uniref:Dpy-30 motif family protein n=1 Tax=Tritrichomonas musculus TaxID=1915356 RepID=A0ABR2L7K5_9EUKA